MDSCLRIIVSGLIAQYPLGGVTWDYLQYVDGLARLGHDVYYVEDSGQWPYNPSEGGVAKSCEYNVRYLADAMSSVGLGERWAYRFPWGSQWFGLSDQRRAEVLGTADLLINVSGTLARLEEYRAVKRLAYVDSDPVFTQLKLARGQVELGRAVDAHDVHFSFGESLLPGAPESGHHWRGTRQPVVLDHWRPGAPYRHTFTTVMNWTSYKAISYEGRRYGQKDVEFRRFLGLPQMVAPITLEVAVNAGKTGRTPREHLAHTGFRVVDPSLTCPDWGSYRRYLESSMAEWSVAKQGYVVGRPGWFSCRSACYLAAGRPVVVQDTGVGSVLPVGEGIRTFTDVEEAADSIRDVVGRYARHAKAGRAIAEEYFDSRKVLGRLIDEAMNGADADVAP